MLIWFNCNGRADSDKQSESASKRQIPGKCQAPGPKKAFRGMTDDVTLARGGNNPGKLCQYFVRVSAENLPGGNLQT
ncbi:hypothetical protein FF011L_25860 [Roseimaritima multifibrata]|uniref:Uncharacterized protein n=1 Tax=Roseimaritima multifibrata TaxID=1930274 RepID=A0A517MFZ6_9BACT|nr:DNA-3-methyladenine glycosylase [Roseimaritima multifibrata]QDS93813.1 hypothetical protein FF011L_25860 [Roseimaritima multifibrata]